jgi:LCP family protein required for cell wall assembly
VGENTDVMFTVRLDGDITHITQVPRDTFIESPQLGVVKANSLFALGGIQTAKDEVGQLLSAPIDRYLKVNLDAVSKLAEALGGVEVDVPKRMYYVDNAQGLYIDLYPGRQLLKGKELEGFLRFRHDEQGDLGRMERQRLVMAKVFSKLADPATIARLPALLEIAGNDMVTDLSPIEMTQLMSALGRTKLSTQRVPGRLYWHNDLSYWMPNSNQVHPSGNGDEPLP